MGGAAVPRGGLKLNIVLGEKEVPLVLPQEHGRALSRPLSARRSMARWKRYFQAAWIKSPPGRRF